MLWTALEVCNPMQPTVVHTNSAAALCNCKQMHNAARTPMFL
jgi:hypothetical protein